MFQGGVPDYPKYFVMSLVSRYQKYESKICFNHCLTRSSSADGFLLGKWKKSHPSIAKLIKYSSVFFRMIWFSTWIMHHFETGINEFTCIGLSWASFMIFVMFWRFSSGGPAFRQDSVFSRFAGGRRQLPSTSYVIFKWSQHKPHQIPTSSVSTWVLFSSMLNLRCTSTPLSFHAMVNMDGRIW